MFTTRCNICGNGTSKKLESTICFQVHKTRMKQYVNDLTAKTGRARGRGGGCTCNLCFCQDEINSGCCFIVNCRTFCQCYWSLHLCLFFLNRSCISAIPEEISIQSLYKNHMHFSYMLKTSLICC